MSSNQYYHGDRNYINANDDVSTIKNPRTPNESLNTNMFMQFSHKYVQRIVYFLRVLMIRLGRGDFRVVNLCVITISKF